MNIPDKPAVYREARRVVRPGGKFVAYDVLQGEGGELHYPVPWARDPSISHLATPGEMREMLAAACFELLEEVDSPEASLEWFRALSNRLEVDGPPPAIGSSAF